jgi:small GTP-binding protein
MFFEGYNPTLEAHYQSEIALEDGKTLAVQITDTAGQEDFASLRDLCMTGGNLFLVVYSVTDFKSLRSAEELLERIAQVKERKVQFVLAGNKCDLEKERQVARADAQDLAKKYNGPFIECSALTKQGIQDIFQALGKLWVERPREPAHPGKRRVRRKKVVRQSCCQVQ